MERLRPSAAITPCFDNIRGQRMSAMRKMYIFCLSIFAIGTVSRIALVLYFHSVSPRLVDVATGHTYLLRGRGGAVFVTPMTGHILAGLQFLPLIFLVLGMLAWAQTWREWK
jgi:hypothetical protein